MPTIQKLSQLYKEVPKIKCDYTIGKVVKGTKYVDHSLLRGNEADLRAHLGKLEQYLKSNPNDIEVMGQITKLRDLLK